MRAFWLILAVARGSAAAPVVVKGAPPAFLRARGERDFPGMGDGIGRPDTAAGLVDSEVQRAARCCSSGGKASHHTPARDVDAAAREVDGTLCGGAFRLAPAGA